MSSQPPGRQVQGFGGQPPPPAAALRPSGDARAQIAATLSSGPRGLPAPVAGGIAELAGRMASDDVLLHRLRQLVAAEGLGVTPSSRRSLTDSSRTSASGTRSSSRQMLNVGDSAASVDALTASQVTASAATAAPSAAEFATPATAMNIGNPQGPPAASGHARVMSGDWVLADAPVATDPADAAASPGPTAPATDAAWDQPALDHAALQAAEDKAVEELRHVFGEGSFVAAPTPSSTGSVSRGTAASGDDLAHSNGNGANGNHAGAATRAAQPRTPTSNGSVVFHGDATGGDAFDAAAVMTSARFWYGHDSDIRSHHRLGSHEDEHMAGDSGGASRRWAPSENNTPRRHHSAAAAASGGALPCAGTASAGDAPHGAGDGEELGTGTVAELWGAIFHTLFTPAGDGLGDDTPVPTREPSAQATAGAEPHHHHPYPLHPHQHVPHGSPEEAQPASSSSEVVSGSSLAELSRTAGDDGHGGHGGGLHHQGEGAAQQVVMDEKFLIAAAMLVNSTLLWVLLSRSVRGPGGAGPGAEGFSDVVGKVADVVQRAFAASHGAAP